MWYVAAIFQLILGFVLVKAKHKAAMRSWVWLVPVADILCGYFLANDQRPWYRMLVYIFLLFLGMKTVSAVYRYSGVGRLNVIQWLAYALGWPGMDPLPFEQLGTKRKVPFPKSIFKQGLVSFIAGNLLLLLLSALVSYTSFPAYLLCLLAFVPVIMIFHQGLFNLGAALWSILGVDLVPLMNAPWKSESVGDFWGKRWNIAFIQMTKITLFLPLARKGKTKQALLLSFFISGIFHEVALSLPVRAGYGLPMLYFVLQSAIVLGEKQFPLSKWPATVQSLWIWLCILLPFPLLIHPAFANGVMLPFLKSLGEVFF